MGKPLPVEKIQRAVGRRIRQARLAVELTQEEAAAEAGIDDKRWQRLESGDVNATIRTLLRVSVALDTTFWELLQQPSSKL